MTRFLINGFNEVCKNIYYNYMKVVDKSMSAIYFLITTKGEFPHAYYIFHKEEPLGTEFKTVACSTYGDLTFLDIKKR